MNAPAADPATIERLYRAHYSELRRWLARRLGNGAGHATDLAQDTFLRMLVRCQSGASAGTELREPMAYLHTIANGLLTDHWRRQALEQAYAEALAQQPAALAPSPEDRALILETLHQLARLIENFKPKVRTAFLMAQLEGLTYVDIASRMGVSVRTVERYMADALYLCHCALRRDGALP